MQGFYDPSEYIPVNELKKLVYEIDGIVYWRVTVGCRGKQDDIAGSMHYSKGELRYQIQICGRKYLRSLIIFALYYDRWPIKGMVIDHIDGNPLNDEITNLREITQAENFAYGRRYNKNGEEG